MNDLRWSGDASGNQPRGFKKTLLSCITQKWTLEHRSITFVWPVKKERFRKAIDRF